MLLTTRPRILVASASAPLQARLISQLSPRYELVTPRAVGRLRNIALAVVDEDGWRNGDAPPLPCPIVVVRAGAGGPPPGADASVRAEFEPEELSERIESQLALARLRANAANKERVLAGQASEARERLSFLVRAAEKMANSLSLPEALDHLCEAAVPRLAQWCMIVLRENGRLTSPAFAHDSAEKHHLLVELSRLELGDGDRRHPIHRALATGRSEFVARAPESFVARLSGGGRRAELLRELGVGAFMCVPLRSRGKTLGAMLLGADARWRPLTGPDLILAEQLATRAGAAIERAQLHQALRRQEEEQAVILDTVRAMIWYKDADNRVLRCNRAAARSAGRTVAEIEGRRVEDIFPSARALAYHRNDLEVISSGKPKIGELEELVLRGGRKRWVQRDTLPYRDARGAIVGVVIIAVDVTERKRAEDLAAAKERAEREFVANVSHEFRTPVAAIKGFAQTLRDGAWRDQAHREKFLDIIEANADRLNALVGDLLTMSELEGSRRRAPVETSVHRAALECVRAHEADAKRKSLNVYIAVPRRLRVKMDPEHLAQALGHLLDNAVKFTPPGGWIRVGARVLKREAHVVVEDSGIGIPSTHLPRVFDRFFRVMKGAQPGNPGVGLHLVKKLVEAYGGSASVRSRLARGSAFCLTLPAVKARKLAAPAPPLDASGSPARPAGA